MGRYYYGNKVSSYGIENNRVDYKTFAAAFNHVSANDLIDKSNFVQIGGFIDNSEEIEELEDKISSLNDKITDDSTQEEDDAVIAEISSLEDEIEELRYQQEYMPEIQQYYIVEGKALEILKENNEIVFYSEGLDLYLWGVTHYGTSWDYVLTAIKLDEKEAA